MVKNPAWDRIFYSVVFVILALSLFYFIFLFFFIIEPNSEPKNVFISNVTEGQATVSYITDKPTKGTVFISAEGKFPFLPLFVNPTKDDGEKNLSKSGFYRTHHITLTDLKSNTVYKYRIYQRLRTVYEGQFKTKNIPTSISIPSPVYGKVLTAEKKPIAGAIVYLQLQNESSKSAFLSTLTNSEGGWTIDLANLSFEGYTKELVIVEAGDKGRGKAYTIPGLDKPWPNILFKK